MAKAVDIDIFKIINAGNFWAHPIASPGSEFQDFMGKLNDHFRNSTTSQALTQVNKGQMCVVRRTSDSCWYRARVQNVLQTLSGPQASVFLVDLAESTLVPCCWIREVPAKFQNIPVQAMECCLIGLKPLGLVTSYFDLTTSKQVTDQWDEAATGVFKTLIQGCKLQVSIQKQDEKGRYHVLLLADSGRSQVCINDELVIKGFATYFSDVEPTSDMSPTKAAKLKAMSDKFQKEGDVMLQNLKDYVKHGKFTTSEDSNSTDEELADHRNHNSFVHSRESPLDVLRRQVLGRSPYQEENGFCEPSARIPQGATQSFTSQRFSPGQSFAEGASGGESSGREQIHSSALPAVLSSDENSGRVRFLSSRLPATGSGMNAGFSGMPSKSPDSTNLKPILKKRSPHQGSGSSSEQDELFTRKQKQMARDDSGISCSEIPEMSVNRTSSGISVRKEPTVASNSISVDTLFGQNRATSRSVSDNANFARKSEVTKPVPHHRTAADSVSDNARQSEAAQPMPQANSGTFKEERSPERILSLIQSLREATGRSYESTLNSLAVAVRTNELSAANQASEIQPDHVRSSEQSSASNVHVSNRVSSLVQSSASNVHETDQSGTAASSVSHHQSQLLPSATSSTFRPPLPSEMLLSSRSSTSPAQPISGTKLSFSDGVFIRTEGAPAPKPIKYLEHCPFAYFLPRLEIMQPKPIQQHAWPALLRGRDVVGICTANLGQIHAYLLPIIYQLVEERQLYSDLPRGANGPQFVILAPTWGRVEYIYRQCTNILARNRNIRVQVIFAAGAEENQILPIVNGCEVLVATPPCFLRMLRKCYITLDRLCHTVFHEADLMVEDFTLEIKEIMRYYAKLLKSQPCRSAPRQAVVMASSWSVGVASLVKAYLGNPVLIIPDMIEAAIYRGVQQVTAYCEESQREVELLGYIDQFIATKDICVFASTAGEAENIGKLLNANCHFALVATEFQSPQEQANVRRQWNTPHTNDAMPVLVMTDAVIEQMNITNASCVIHFTFPNKTKFGRRLTTLAGTFTAEEHGCVSVIFVTGVKNILHSPSVCQLVKRSGQDVPQWLEDMAVLATQQREEAQDLCFSVKAFGTCRYKRGTKPCHARHSLLAELDTPVTGVPSSGIVKVLILNVVDATCYWVRILDHKPINANQTQSQIADSTEFLELTMAVSGWYADPSHRVKQELVTVGDLCAVKLENSNSFHRVKVGAVTKDDHNRKPLEVVVHYVDRGVHEAVHVDRLLQLPPQFHSCPYQAVQVFLGGVQPLDKDIEWTEETSAFVAHHIEGKEMEGKVVLSLGNTMWLDPLVERKYLENINVTTNAFNVRLELLKDKRATENKQHVRLLRNMCEGVIDLLPLEGTPNSAEEISVEQLPVLETVMLPEDGYHSVYVSAVEHPGLFFIQLRSSEESLEELKQKINSGVGRVDSEGSEITIGSFCVAKFSQDDLWYRARVLGSRPDNEYDLFYVDFGDREWVTADRIVSAWKNILQLPLQAIECSLVNVDPRANEWSEESSDAFWDMVTDQLLVAKVKSKNTSLVAGRHRFAIELYNTNTEHDVIISYEMVAAGHAQSSPEGIKMLFPYSNPASEQVDYDFPYQRIPDMCLQVHQCWDSEKKVEIVKQVQSIVLNNETSKDDIRDCGGIQALCRLLSLNRDPQVLQHILASLASLSFENESNCDEVRNQGGLQTMCYLLGKIEDSSVQESIAWALKNLAATERNQNGVKNRGGIKALCELLNSASDEKVLERVTWAIGSLVQDNISNCQAVQECGGLKTLCELVAQTHSESVLERTTWSLGMLATDLKNRNFIRQYGGIENINKMLQESPSQQIIKQGALTLKTLASNNQYNKDVMIRLGMIGTLRSFMTDEPQKLGIIARRVCWDLLQRLLGTPADNTPIPSPQAAVPVSRTQASSTSPGSDKRQEPEARNHNGVANNDVNGGSGGGGGDDDDDNDLPPLGGEDSVKENGSSTPVNAVKPPANTSAKVAATDNASKRVTQRNAVTSARPINQPRPSAAEGENRESFRVHPKTVWSQTKELVRVCVKLRGVERQQTEITASRLLFRTQMGHSMYELDLELFEDIDSERSVVLVKGAEVQILLKKRNHAVWTRLLKSKEKLPYISIDFDRWEVWSSSEGEEDDDNANARAPPSNPNASRRDSEDRGQSKQVLLPEMLVSDSDSNEESVPSDIDCMDFR